MSCVVLHVVVIIALVARSCPHAQGVTPCLLALASFGAEGASIICRNKLRSNGTDAELGDDMPQVNPPLGVEVPQME